MTDMPRPDWIPTTSQVEEFNALRDNLFDFKLEQLARLPRHWAEQPEWLREFRTLTVMLGRQTGSSTWVAEKSAELAAAGHSVRVFEPHEMQAKRFRSHYRKHSDVAVHGIGRLAKLARDLSGATEDDYVFIDSSILVSDSQLDKMLAVYTKAGRSPKLLICT